MEVGLGLAGVRRIVDVDVGRQGELARCAAGPARIGAAAAAPLARLALRGAGAGGAARAALAAVAFWAAGQAELGLAGEQVVERP